MGGPRSSSSAEDAAQPPGQVAGCPAGQQTDSVAAQKPRVTRRQPVVVRRATKKGGLLPDRAGEDEPVESGYRESERKTDQEYYAERPPHW